MLINVFQWFFVMLILFKNIPNHKYNYILNLRFFNNFHFKKQFKIFNYLDLFMIKSLSY
jgi:hypothetical protein